jgi:hypothetical protein
MHAYNDRSTLDGCPFAVLNDTSIEYRVKVTCGPIGKILTS